MNEHDSEQRTIAPDGRPPEEQPAWRGDFPIDWPQDRYVGRRDLTKFLVLTSLAFVVGQVWIGIQNWVRRGKGKPSLPAQPIARLDDVKNMPVGDVRTFSYPGEHDPCLLVRLEDEGGKPRFAAYDQRCTHLSCGVVADKEDKDRLFCPCHHGYFDARTGRPVAGPPRRPLPIIQTEQRGDEIYAIGVQERTV